LCEPILPIFEEKVVRFLYIYEKLSMHFLYFDPGLGAMVIQAIVAAVAGVILFSKNLLYKIKIFFNLVKDDDDLFDDINIKDTDVENKTNSDK
jgi:hypothetical protein